MTMSLLRRVTVPCAASVLFAARYNTMATTSLSSSLPPVLVAPTNATAAGGDDAATRDGGAALPFAGDPRVGLWREEEALLRVSVGRLRAERELAGMRRRCEAELSALRAGLRAREGRVARLVRRVITRNPAGKRRAATPPHTNAAGGAGGGSRGALRSAATTGGPNVSAPCEEATQRVTSARHAENAVEEEDVSHAGRNHTAATDECADRGDGDHLRYNDGSSGHTDVPTHNGRGEDVGGCTHNGNADDADRAMGDASASNGPACEEATNNKNGESEGITLPPADDPTLRETTAMREGEDVRPSIHGTENRKSSAPVPNTAARSQGGLDKTIARETKSKSPRAQSQTKKKGKHNCGGDNGAKSAGRKKTAPRAEQKKPKSERTVKKSPRQRVEVKKSVAPRSSRGGGAKQQPKKAARGKGATTIAAQKPRKGKSPQPTGRKRPQQQQKKKDTNKRGGTRSKTDTKSNTKPGQKGGRGKRDTKAKKTFSAGRKKVSVAGRKR